MILFQFCSWQLNENSSDLDFLPTARSYNRRPWRSCHDPCHVQKRKIWLQRNVKQVTPQGLFHELCWKITIVESASSSSDDDYSPPPLSRDYSPHHLVVITPPHHLVVITPPHHLVVITPPHHLVMITPPHHLVVPVASCFSGALRRPGFCPGCVWTHYFVRWANISRASHGRSAQILLWLFQALAEKSSEEAEYKAKIDDALQSIEAHKNAEVRAIVLLFSRL